MKTIPIYLKGRIVAKIKEKKPVITRVYERFWRIYNIYKIHHIQGQKIIIETKDENKRIGLVL